MQHPGLASGGRCSTKLKDPARVRDLMRGISRSLLVVGLLALASFSILPSASASTGCWYTETTQQELVAVGPDVVYLELDQPVYSGTCDPADTVPAAVHCAAAGVGEGSLTTPPVSVVEVRVLGMTLVEEGVLVPEQTVPVPEEPGVVLLDEPRCTSERPVARLVIDSDYDSEAGTDGTLVVGTVPFVGPAVGTLDGACGAVSDAETCWGVPDSILAQFIIACEDNRDPDWNYCRGGSGPVGLLVRVFGGTYEL